MALIFTDPNSAGPFQTFQVKDVTTKVFKLTNAHFTVTTSTKTKVGTLPPDASIIRFTIWNKTKLAGASINSAALGVGTTSGGTEFISALDVFVNAGTMIYPTAVTLLMQGYNVPNTTEIPIWVDGLSGTGTPTSGELYLMVEYVR
jgi:hypothetical protein